ncbi:MAG: vWA domain-containing protein [Candidatus Cryptobacteroides sp.]
MTYNVDIVMCIDLSSSMQNRLNEIKENASDFLPALRLALKAANKKASNIRVKIIGFRDFNIDGPDALIESPLYKLDRPNCPDQKGFNDFVNGLTAKGGNKEGYSNSLEALSLAINSDWEQEGDRKRHVIVMFSDAVANKLEEANTSNPHYPQNIPQSFEELSESWMMPSGGQQGSKTKLIQPAKRLIVYGKEVYPWLDIYESWDQVVYCPVGEYERLDVNVYEDIILSIVASV